jgi:hypothetical protein
MPRHEPFAASHAWRLAQRMARSGAALLPVAALTLLLGMALYHWLEGLSWSSAFLNAAMLLGGMGPVDPVHSEAGKWLIGLYALFAGIVFLVVTGTMLAPVVHHVLVRWHLESAEGDGKPADE